MIALLIISIMTVGGIIAVNGYLKKAKKRAAITMIKNLKNGIREFKEDIHQYPQKLNDLIVKPKDDRGKNWDGPYGIEDVEEIPEDPWGNPYKYKVTSGGGKHPYELYSEGPDGEGPKIDVWE
jgi:general secretion pathway protein G